MNNCTIDELYDLYRNDEGMQHFLKAIEIHNDMRNEQENPNILVVPGKCDLMKADKVLSALGYRRYSIDYLPKKAYGYDTTQVTFRNAV